LVRLVAQLRNCSPNILLSCGNAELAEIVEASKPVRAGLDGMSGLVQELADIADALVDRLGPDSERPGTSAVKRTMDCMSAA
jgi:hypothetical protein